MIPSAGRNTIPFPPAPSSVNTIPFPPPPSSVERTVGAVSDERADSLGLSRLPSEADPRHQMNDEALLQMVNKVEQLRDLRREDDGLQNADEVRGCLERCDLSAIVVIKAERVGLKCLPVELGKFSNLTVLYLSGNALTSLPDEVCDLRKLVTVILSDNRLTSLPENFGHLSGLEQLVIKRNRLRALPENFGDLTRLENCRLNRNKLTSLPGSIGGLKRLEYFNVCKNKLKSIPDSINSLSKLHYLDITGNLFESPPNIYNLAVNGVLTILKMDQSIRDQMPKEMLSAIRQRRVLEFSESHTDEEN